MSGGTVDVLPKQVVQTIDCATTGDFFALFGPEGTVGKHLGEFVFRGLPSSDYSLTPSLFRNFPKIYEKVKGDIPPSLQTSKDIPLIFLIQVEYALLRDFYLTANNIGIRLPYIPLFLRDEINAINRFDLEGYPFEEMQQIAALAQHYGLPTRLLDWSYNLFSALFFAVSGITDGAPKNPKIVLWCLKQSMINLEYNRITKVITNYADNPNINAQKGLFFYWADTSDFPGKFKNLYKPIVSCPLDKYLNDLYLSEKGNENLKNAVNNGGPVLLKITLPAENAEKIAKYLGAFGYTKATTFPSLDSAVSETKKHFSL